MWGVKEDKFIGAILSGRFQVMEEIGAGGMSVVYRGEDIRSGRSVAIKIMREESMSEEGMERRFEAEAKALRQLQHPHIVRTYAQGETEGQFYIVMEYVKGETLKERIAREGHVSIEKAVGYAMQLLDALAYSHEQGVLHRDIKPHNIIITPKGHVKLVDFGLARSMTTDTVTFAGANVLGSVHYFSPEQASGSMTSERADIYSMGILLYEMVTGVLPFQGDTAVTVALKHLRENPVAPSSIDPEIPASIENVILKAIQKDPALRYANARLMQVDLQRVLQEPDGLFVELHQIYEKELSASEQKTAAKDKGSAAARQGRSQSFRLLVATIVIVGIFVTLFYIGSMLLMRGERNKLNALMPDLRNMTQEEAEDLLFLRNLKGQFTLENHNTIAEGYVCRQVPAADVAVAEGSTVQVVISIGPNEVQVPDVRNKPLEEAEKMLADHGLTVGTVEKQGHLTLPSGTVIEQSPLPGETLLRNDEVNLVVSQ